MTGLTLFTLFLYKKQSHSMQLIFNSNIQFVIQPCAGIIY